MIKMNVKKMMATSQGERELAIDLKIESAEFVALFAASGEGKTTLLRMLAGLTTPSEGCIEVDGQVWFDSRRKINLSVQDRRAGFVFQQHCLFPQMTIRENLNYALRPNDKNSTDHWLAMMDLTALANQRPHQLSSGQRQRVALARALVNRPQILLLDEPFSALDINLRLKLQDEIVKIYRETKITTILVSHDLSEVIRLSGKIFIIEQGRIVRSGHPQDIFINNNVSGKFKFVGEIVAIDQDGVVYILTVQIGNNLTKVIATDEEIKKLKVGSKVIVATKAFNPLILECEVK